MKEKEEQTQNKEARQDVEIPVYDEEAKELIVLEGISPIVIHVENLLESCNNSKSDLDENNIEDNINHLDKVVDLSPKQIKTLKKKQGRSKKKKNSSSIKPDQSNSVTIHTRSPTAKTK